MSLVDRLLARRSVMFTAPLSVAECHDRIGSDSPYGGGIMWGANGTSPYIVHWRGDREVTLTKPWARWSRRMHAQCSLRVRFDPQPESTFVEVGVGLALQQVLNYAFIFLFFAAFALGNWSSVLHSRGQNPVFGLGTVLLIGPGLYVADRLRIARQGPDLVSNLEGLLEAVTSPAL